MSADLVPGGSGSAKVRASNADREHTAAVLRAAAGEGMLTLEEVDERLAAAYAATYRSDLQPLTWDLPHHGRDLAGATPEARREAQAMRNGLRAHAGLVLAVAVLLVTIWAVSGASYFWPIWPIGFLVLSVIRHARWRGAWGPGWQRRGGYARY
jgi:hypothetical protein